MGAGSFKNRRYAASKTEVVVVADLGKPIETETRVEARGATARFAPSVVDSDSAKPSVSVSGKGGPSPMTRQESFDQRNPSFVVRTTTLPSSKPRRGVSRKFLSLWKSDKELREFKPHVDFLRAIASPETKLSVYCHTIISEVVKVLEAERCSIYFVDEIRKEVWCIGASDCEPFRLPWERGIAGLVARAGKTLNISDPHSHDAFESAVEQRTGYAVRNMLTVPIRHMVDQARAVGVIQCLNKQGDSGFTTQDEHELEKFAMIISDSFYRQRWRALESSAKLEQESLALLATMTAEVSSKPKTSSDGRGSDLMVVNNQATAPFVWHDASVREEDLTVEHAVPEISICGAGGSSREDDAPSSGPDALRKLCFNTLAYSADDLVRLVPFVLDDTGVLQSGCVIPDRLRSWVWAVERTYRSNPFHNWHHAFSVFQAVYAQLRNAQFQSLRFLDVFALLVAALCHDLGHPGLTNSFLVDGEDELAVRYNDNSVLENHHAFLACELLRTDETAIGACLSKADQKALRRMVIKSILDTDMMRHNDLCQQTLARVASSPDEETAANPSPSDRQWVMSMVLHTSDLSAQLQKWPVAAAWEERISQEFVNQASIETASGRTPAPFMQFSMDDLPQRGKLQRNFIDYVLVPIWDPYTQLLPSLRPCFSRLLSNREKYDYRSMHGSDPPPEKEEDPVQPRAMLWPCC